MMLKGAKMARLGSARLGSSIAPFIQCVKLYYINLSDKIRKLGVLCPVFGFFLLWEGGSLLKLYA